MVTIPCYNEEVTIGKVINNFKVTLPTSLIYVFDNNSTDNSSEISKDAGAIVIRVLKQGKGHVLQRILDLSAEIKPDAVVIVDGDDTYNAEDVHKLMAPVLTGDADMVVGNRMPAASSQSMLAHRQFGNKLIVRSINLMFGTNYRDILSGYRVLSRRFIENVPLLTPGFETETEMTLQALEEGMIIREIPISYRSRPQDSHSKLNAFSDGYRIMLTAAMLLRDHNPLRFFGIISIILFFAAIIISILTLINQSDPFQSYSTIFFITVLMVVLLGALSFSLGLILNAVNTRFRQLKQIIQRKK
jgi:glycosyltransferase involved in cell wall biosynthesis